MLSFLVISLIFLLFISAFFSGAETALFSLSSLKIKSLRKELQGSGRLVVQLLESPKDLLVTLILGNVVVNILIQNIVSTLFGKSSSWILNVGVPLGLIVIFGEFIPKSIGMANNYRLAPLVAPVLVGASWLFTPLRRTLTAMTQVISRLMFFFLKKEEKLSAEELQMTLKTSRERGILHADEGELVQGYLQLEGASIKEFLRPREEVLFFDIQEPLSKLLELFVDQECSRIPVCEGNFDHILGIITARNYFLYRSKIQTPQDLFPYLKKPFYVPESLPAKNLLGQMYEREDPLAIVVDEYGATSGLISFEDLVEVVVGEIVDRRDEKMPFTRSGNDVIIASGTLELCELEEIFGIAFKSERNMVTLGGWLTEQMGDIPKSGSKFETQEFFFHVLSADSTRVKRVYVRRLKEG
ncbi:MAG TPA: HlyC/CorC family transporter [Parachlamydiales bacterium]|nr:HlyC/CorC family transporter [Parachlamydiales bacterium]HCJ83585.1 HlyC/CorC family transporter [Parachlamydiales bacterium]